MRKIVFILMFLSGVSYSQIPYDKQMHFLGGATVSTVTYLITYDATQSKGKAFLYSFLSSVLVGTSMEIFDSFQEGNKFDVKDLGATMLGGLTVSVTFEIFKKRQPKQTDLSYNYTD